MSDTDPIALLALERTEEAVERIIDAVGAEWPDAHLGNDAIREAVRLELGRFNPVMDDEESEAMDHLHAFAQIVQGQWHLRTNHDELAAAIRVLQGYVVNHMLNRLAPESWRGWYASDVDELVERIGDVVDRAAADPDRLKQPAGVELVKVQILGNWTDVDTEFAGPNFAGVTATVDRESLRALLMSNPLPGNFREVTSGLADYLIGNLGIADRLEAGGAS